MMDKKEFTRLASIIRAYYPNALRDGESLNLWYEQLQDVPFAEAESNLKKHVSTSKFVPTIAEIRGGYKRNDFTDIAQRDYSKGESYDLSRICDLDIQCLREHGLGVKG